MFEGTSVTSRKTLLHDVTFKPGDPFDIRAVRETIARLQMQPYIASASAGTPAVRQQPFASASVRSDSVDTVIVPLRIQERSGLGLEGVMGFRSDANPENRLFGQVDVTLLNVFGSGESATFDYRGDQTRNSLGIDITKPHLLGYPITAEAGFALEIAREQYGFLEGTIGLLSRLSTYWHGGLVLRASEATDQGVDSTGALTFYGLDFVLRRSSYPGSRGVRSWSLETNMGTGTALRDAGRFTRWRIDTRASIHQPLFKRQALSLTGVGRTIITDEQDRLQPVERFRAGGHESIRGYAENEFSFQTLAYGQCEYLFYLAALGALYAFVDGGAGFTEMVDFSASSRTDLLGYGLGMRIPSRFGTLSLEWARSRVDRSNLGRIHIRFRNSLVRENNR
jgi:outer membrane protein assembly factor BamA